MDPPTPLDAYLVQEFNDALRVFVDALSVCFNQCPALRLAKAALANTPRDHDAAVRTWHRAMDGQYGKCVSQCDDVIPALSGHSLLAAIDLAGKWRLADAATRDCIWGYVATLNRLSLAYHVTRGRAPAAVARTIHAAVSGTVGMPGMLGMVRANLGDPATQAYALGLLADPACVDYAQAMAAASGVDVAQLAALAAGGGGGGLMPLLAGLRPGAP